MLVPCAVDHARENDSISSRSAIGTVPRRTSSVWQYSVNARRREPTKLKGNEHFEAALCHFPRTRSDTRDCAIPSRLAAWSWVSLCFSMYRRRSLMRFDRIYDAAASGELKIEIHKYIHLRVDDFLLYVYLRSINSSLVLKAAMASIACSIVIDFSFIFTKSLCLLRQS